LPTPGKYIPVKYFLNNNIGNQTGMTPIAVSKAMDRNNAVFEAYSYLILTEGLVFNPVLTIIEQRAELDADLILINSQVLI
jgi:hypothetical protein